MSSSVKDWMEWGLVDALSQYAQAQVTDPRGMDVLLRISVSKSLIFVVSDISDGNSRVKCFIRTQIPRSVGRCARSEPRH